MTGPDEARIAAAGAIFDLIGSRSLPLDRGQIADRLAAAALGAAARDSSEMHELVFTDRLARPAKWETRCGRTDVPLERAGSAGPGMHYPVTCRGCLRTAGLEAALKRFEHLEESAIAAAVKRGIDQALAEDRQIRVSGSELYLAAVAAERERCITLLRATAAEWRRDDGPSAQVSAGAFEDAADLIEGEK